jgi:hypothetical protein
MAGLGGTITPVRSGNIFVTISGTGWNSTVGQRFGVGIRYGTGTAPVNGAALVGTVVTGTQYGTMYAASANMPFSLSAVITGLTLGTPIWIDLAYLATAGTTTLYQVTVAAFELP